MLVREDGPCCLVPACSRRKRNSQNASYRQAVQKAAEEQSRGSQGEGYSTEVEGWQTHQRNADDEGWKRARRQLRRSFGQDRQSWERRRKPLSFTMRLTYETV